MEEEEPEKVDIMILGASGFTGKYVIREALKFINSSPSSFSPSSSSSPPLKLGLAGRSKPKILSALKWASSPSPPPGIPIFEADVSNPLSLSSLCKQTRLLLNCVGPFRLYGEPVVSECIRAGIDYLDITGEPEFMEKIEALYHEKAVQSNSLVISACGFDSVPAELGFVFNSRQWEPPSILNSIDAYLVLESDKRIVGNVGTLESAILGLSSFDELQRLRRSRPKRPRPQIPGPPTSKGELIQHQKSVGLWAVKLPSADAIVVRRTLTSLTENPNGLSGVNETPDHISKREKFWSQIKPAHFGVKIGYKSPLGIIRLIVVGIIMGILTRCAFGRSLLSKYPEIFTLGWFRKSGPTEEEVRSASFKMWFVGRGYSDESQLKRGKMDKEVITRVSGPEIGYITTPIILVQCALVLLKERGNLPRGGVYTPGIVFGPTDLQKHLQENGLSFELISKNAQPT
ncbi:probable mitochondrial saccharopine dehydrogenase-like oxidoreductase At5g39410 [Amborella trichopoda]|uniref:Saccharopine dehydrogenase NADP binding domain-containing protein n=1 Tax=Amborella trichopoda TaxID=13333 RepID=W1PRF8_AMBTC|nr:probable mitochondrial saccharopine dehydrogenase-like oxidoreductase At5g39410 [Amborella trichopoda]ERN10291.1 hypothetical protein AMTR_s00177p00032620 [Amborella trichopoda]|eukprot:XP_006848710.1 probable mitochondrial saccharopine dehydrogenase-like oxidoreductase At5g39410 [Amborella trichopoda]